VFKEEEGEKKRKKEKLRKPFVFLVVLRTRHAMLKGVFKGGICSSQPCFSFGRIAGGRK
jgi:hypothetical protein